MNAKIKEMYRKYYLWILLLSIAIFLFLIFLIPILIWTSPSELFNNPESIKAFILSFEGWAIFVYIILSIITIIAPPLPNEIVPVVGGIVFGFWDALIFSLFARIIGSSINYWLGGRIRKGVCTKLLNEEDQDKLKRYTEKIGWQTVFISRFLPSVDTDLIAYIAGVAKMKYLPFLLASFLGMIVPVSVSVFVGSSLSINKYLFFLLVGFYVGGILFAPKIIKIFFKKGK